MQFVMNILVWIFDVIEFDAIAWYYILNCGASYSIQRLAQNTGILAYLKGQGRHKWHQSIVLPVDSKP